MAPMFSLIARRVPCKSADGVGLEVPELQVPAPVGRVRRAVGLLPPPRDGVIEQLPRWPKLISDNPPHRRLRSPTAA